MKINDLDRRSKCTSEWPINGYTISSYIKEIYVYESICLPM